MSENNIRTKCTCGAFIDTKVLEKMKPTDAVKFMMKHLKHMYRGEKVNLYKLKVNGKIQSFDRYDTFDEKYIFDEVYKIMKKSEPDDIIEIINVSKNGDE